jgi:hypothetical protein
VDEPVDADALIGLLDENLERLGDVEKCRVRWMIYPDSWVVQVLSKHRLNSHGRDFAYVGLFYEKDEEIKVWYVLSILGGPAGHVLVGPQD